MSTNALQQRPDARSEPAIEPLPDDISSSSAKLVYLYIATSGGTSLDDLQSTLGLKKLALFSVLDTLQGCGLVECDDRTYTLA